MIIFSNMIRLIFRSDYFKKAEDFKAATGDTTKVFEVKECSHRVLEAVINFMYGIDISSPPTADLLPFVEGLLTMADLYLMEDLKDAVASFMAPLLTQDNTLETLRLAEKFTATKLEEACTNFISTNISVANQVLGLDAAHMFNKKSENLVKKGMIVRCNANSYWYTEKATGLTQYDPPIVFGNPFAFGYEGSGWSLATYKVGTIGRIVNGNDTNGQNFTIKWISNNSLVGRQAHAPRGNISHLDILTPPIDASLFKDIK